MENSKSLYRKYRPKNLDEVAGHTNIKEILIQEIQNKNFPHALMFSGQRGTGKTSIAKIVAKAINCFDIQGYNPCEKCESCLEFNNNSHPDILEMDAASNNGVDEIRNIKLNISTLPTISKYKVYIVDEVHMLTNSAFNALLKTLEEPPKHVVFILATTEFIKIPETIVSRCQLFNFRAVTKKALETRIKEVCQYEGKQINEDALQEIYYLSEGSLRDALNYLEQTIAVAGEMITATDLKKVFYITTKTDKIQLLQNVFAKKPEEIIVFFERASDEGVDFQSTLLGIIQIVKELITFKMTNNKNHLSILNLDDIEIFHEIDLADLFKFVDNSIDVYTKLRNSNINFQYILLSILKTINDLDKPISVNIENPVLKDESKLVQKEEQEFQITDDTQNNQESFFGTLQQNQTKDIKNNEDIYKGVPQQENKNQVDIENNNHQSENQKFENNQEVSNETNIIVTSEDAQQAPVEDFFVETKQEENVFSKQLTLMRSEFGNTPFNYKIDDEDILEIVATSSKPERLLVEDRFSQINADQEIQSSKTFLPFVNSKIKCANKECFVIVNEVQGIAKWINWKLQNEQYRKLLANMFGFSKIIVALEKDQWMQIKNEFMFRKGQNTLPTISHVVNEQTYYQGILVHEEPNDITSEIVAVFGDDVKVVD